MSEITNKLKVLGEKWANLPDGKEANEIADEVMEELPELLSKTEQLEKACAEMRQIVEIVQRTSQSSNKEMFISQPALAHALSTSCGSDYIHRDEVKPLVEALELSTYLVSHCGVFQWKTGFKTEHSFAKCAKSIEQALTNSRRI